MRGTTAKENDERISANGYTYIKAGGTWRLKHHVLAEKKLGRAIKGNERVCFIDGDKTNLKVSNIEVRPKGTGSLRRRKAAIEARIDELKAELDAINAELR